MERCRKSKDCRHCGRKKRSARLLKESGAHPNMISKWKKELIENADSAFRNGKSAKEKELEGEKEELYRQLGKLHAATDFLNKTHSRQGLM